MSARRSSGSGRRWRHGHQAELSRRQRRTIPQLVFTIVALVSLFLFWNEISSGTAGCFTKMTASPQTFPAGESVEPAESLHEKPSIRVKLPSSTPRSAVDAASTP